MKGKALFAVGVAVGYVWGSKSWPEVYRRVRGGTQKLWKNPEVQENVHQATEAVQESVPDILDNLYEAGKKLLEKAESVFPGITAPKAGQHPGSGTPGDKSTVSSQRTVSSQKAESTLKTEPTGASGNAAGAGPAIHSDVVSDPALDDTTGSDWTDEGGAAPEGPATNTPPKH
ncbi:hypothetical protein [Paenarthrobacter aurescens]|uniref:YtxH domain-containing protein n=1 Tax=Paenarthrobacter aurescens TaxID=43663 RepID=A0A4Y3NCM5_PAEAU|nr:hypothetical protein [Paenarthrobacter aurescens]MDO6145382.1 hypothetical protein [Paenarthrobacter aurescens]MDO6149187.1 hypothetical protein [Paenarthrobacter aurescens]MDO6160431.1 hypothetical protein [Paenarthrobacter aurescens]MDO6164290.1 hypothetical protein [Paenarthrobacter aurescens]GEB19590.1 hypothetical protein AAU01_23450 [Paenarthrobacter aurescens]